jgi:hypothetical protein
MNTKICKICKIEKSVEEFKLVCKKYTSVKTGIIKMIKNYNSYCKKCTLEHLKKYTDKNPEIAIKARLKHSKTDKFKKGMSTRRKKHNFIYRDKLNIQSNNFRKQQRELLSYSYIKQLWKDKFKTKNLPVPEFTSDIYIAEQIRIYTNRQINEAKQRIRKDVTKSE